MARIWTELAEPKRHIDYMLDWSVGGHQVQPAKDNLLRHNVLLVEVNGFTFQFHSKAQLAEAIAFFSKPIHRSSMLPHVTLEHFWHPWSQRLPKGLNARIKRSRILSALVKAMSSKAVVKALRS